MATLPLTQARTIVSELGGQDLTSLAPEQQALLGQAQSRVNDPGLFESVGATINENISPFAKDAGNLTTGALADLVGEGFAADVGGRVAEMAVESSPTIATLFGTRAIPDKRLQALAAFVGAPLLEASRSYAETADPISALGSAAAFPISFLTGGALAGAAPSVGKRFLSDTVGGAVGDLAEIGLFKRPEEDDKVTLGDVGRRIINNPVDFFSDPVNAGAYALFQTVPGAAGALGQTIKNRKLTRQDQAAATKVDNPPVSASLDQFFSIEPSERFAIPKSDLPDEISVNSLNEEFRQEFKLEETPIHPFVENNDQVFASAVYSGDPRINDFVKRKTGQELKPVPLKQLEDTILPQESFLSEEGDKLSETLLDSDKVRADVEGAEPTVLFTPTNPDDLLSNISSKADDPNNTNRIMREVLDNLKVSLSDVNVATTKDEGVGGFFNKPANTVGINSRLNSKTAFNRLGHELSHVALENTFRQNPELYARARNFVTQLSPNQRKEILSSLNKAAGTKVDPDRLEYLVGNKFDSNAASWPDATAHEFVAGVAETFMGLPFGEQKPNFGKLEQLYYQLPMELRSLIGRIMAAARTLFRPDSYGSVLTPETAKKVQEALDMTGEVVYKAEQKEEQVFQHMKRFDEVYNLGNMAEQFAQGNVLGTKLPANNELSRFGMTDTFYSPEKETAIFEKEGTQHLSGYLKHWASGIGTSLVYPFTRNLFSAISRYRPGLQSYLSAYRMMLAKQPEGRELSETQALKEWNNELIKLGKQPQRMEKIGASLFEDQVRREEGQDIQSDAEMSSRGLSEDDVGLVNRLRQTILQVGRDYIRLMGERNQLEVARMLSAMFDGNIDKAVQASATLHKSIDFSQSIPDKDAALSQAIGGILQQMGYDVKADPTGAVRAAELIYTKMQMQADARKKMSEQFAVEGYFPMVRRRQFIVKKFVYDDKGAPDFSKMEVKDFDTEKEAQAYADEDQGFDKVILLDKKGLADRYQYMSFSGLEDFFNNQANTFDEIVSKYLSDETASPQEIEALTKAGNEFKHSLAQEVSNMITTKGDPYSKQRNLVKGFRQGDFIPNALEYIDNKTISAVKGIARAQAELEMTRKEILDNPELKKKLRQDIEYSLSANAEEWGFLKKFTFNWYLAMSVKQLIQNSFQTFQISIPHFAEVTNTWGQGYNYWIKANKLALEDSFSNLNKSKKGTGDPILNQLLTRAKKERLISPRILNAFMKTNDIELSEDINRGAAYGLGKGGKVQAKRWGHTAQEIVNSPTAVSDVAQRKVAFLMRAKYDLDQIKKSGLTPSDSQIEAIYQNAVNFMEDTNFIGDKANRPGVIKSLGNSPAHGPVLVATALMNHVMNHFTLMYSYLAKGDAEGWSRPAGGLLTRGGKRVAQLAKNSTKLSDGSVKAFWLNMGHMIGLAGLVGLPFYQDLDAILEKLFGKSYDKEMRKLLNDGMTIAGFEGWEKNKASDLIFAGLPGLLGADLTYSMGLGNVLNYNVSQPYGLDDLGGATVDLFKRLVTSASNFKRGGVNEVTLSQLGRQTAPQGFNYWIKMNDIMREGTFRTRSGQPATVGPLSTLEKATVALGFQPLNASKLAEVRARQRYDEKQLSEKRRSQVNQIAWLLNSGNNQDAQNHFQVLRELDPSIDPSSLVRSITDAQANLRSPALQAPNLTQQRLLEDTLNAFPGFEFPVRSKVSTLGNRVSTAANLGQDKVLSSGLESLERGLPQAIAYDKLVSAGYPPAVAALLSGMISGDNLDFSKLALLGDNFLPNTATLQQ